MKRQLLGMFLALMIAAQSSAQEDNRSSTDNPFDELPAGRPGAGAALFQAPASSKPLGAKLPEYQLPPGSANASDMSDAAMSESAAIGEHSSGDVGYSGCVDGSCGTGSSCSMNSCNSCDTCNDGCGVWVRGEYLLWVMEGTRPPALVTTATGGGNGALGSADTTILFGTDLIDDEERSGTRFSVGAWLGDDRTDSIEGSFFNLEDTSTGFDVQSDGSQLIARPFFNVETGVNAVQLIASPGISTGGVFVSTSSELLGAELMLRRSVIDCCHGRVDFLYGYRYLELEEDLRIRDELTSIDPGGLVPVGTVIGGTDIFDTNNQFHGGQIGMSMDVKRSRWTMGLVGKVALGNMSQHVRIDGSTFVAVPAQPVVDVVGGLLTQPSNIGSYDRDQFAVIPEFNFNVKYQLSRRLEASIGYTFIYVSDVVRPADQVDFRLDPRQITDPANATAFPAFSFVDSDFWVQGLNVGLEYRF